MQGPINMWEQIERGLTLIKGIGCLFYGRRWVLIFTIFITGNETCPESFLLHNALARKPKRIRTAFSPSQLLRLEHAFEKNHYVVGAERKQLAHCLNLTETQVRWSLPVFISVYSHMWMCAWFYGYNDGLNNYWNQ